MCDTLPMSCDRELGPSAWENLTNIDLVVVFFPLLVVHPPVTIVFELITESLSQLGLIIPSLIFVTETTIPLSRARTPWVTNI